MRTSFFIACLFFYLFTFSQQDSIQTFKVKKANEGFDIADFCEAIGADTTGKLSVIIKKYFAGVNGLEKRPWNDKTNDPMIMWENDEMIMVVYILQKKSYSIKLEFKKGKYPDRSVVALQLRNGKFSPGMTNKMGKTLNTEYFNRIKNLYIDMKSREDDVMGLNFK